MPSEQAQGKPQFSSDIYAVGMIGIQALTGIFALELPTDVNTGEFVWRDQAQVNDEIAAILDKMVCYDFRQRYQSAKEVLQALEDKNRILTVPPYKPTILSGFKSLLNSFRF